MKPTRRVHFWGRQQHLEKRHEVLKDIKIAREQQLNKLKQELHELEKNPPWKTFVEKDKTAFAKATKERLEKMIETRTKDLWNSFLQARKDVIMKTAIKARPKKVTDSEKQKLDARVNKELEPLRKRKAELEEKLHQKKQELVAIEDSILQFQKEQEAVAKMREELEQMKQQLRRDIDEKIAQHRQKELELQVKKGIRESTFQMLKKLEDTSVPLTNETDLLKHVAAPVLKQMRELLNIQELEAKKQEFELRYQEKRDMLWLTFVIEKSKNDADRLRYEVEVTALLKELDVTSDWLHALIEKKYNDLRSEYTDKLAKFIPRKAPPTFTRPPSDDIPDEIKRYINDEKNWPHLMQVIKEYPGFDVQKVVESVLPPWDTLTDQEKRDRADMWENPGYIQTYNIDVTDHEEEEIDVQDRDELDLWAIDMFDVDHDDNVDDSFWDACNFFNVDPFKVMRKDGGREEFINDVHKAVIRFNKRNPPGHGIQWLTDIGFHLHQEWLMQGGEPVIRLFTKQGWGRNPIGKYFRLYQPRVRINPEPPLPHWKDIPIDDTITLGVAHKLQRAIAHWESEYRPYAARMRVKMAKLREQRKKKLHESRDKFLDYWVKNVDFAGFSEEEITKLEQEAEELWEGQKKKLKDFLQESIRKEQAGEPDDSKLPKDGFMYIDLVPPEEEFKAAEGEEGEEGEEEEGKKGEE